MPRVYWDNRTVRASRCCSRRMQSSYNCFYGSFPHPFLVFIALLKCLICIRLPKTVWKRNIIFLLFLAVQFIQWTVVLALSQQHILGVHAELFTSSNPQILCHRTTFPEFKLPYWRSALNSLFLEHSFCIWLCSNRPLAVFNRTKCS